MFCVVVFFSMIRCLKIFTNLSAPYTLKDGVGRVAHNARGIMERRGAALIAAEN
jgi:hypothetical protein